MEEEDVLCRFGTPLEPLEEDEIPTKKPILIEDQIVTDENGRRRFHGAFTGGFSAGFWNTVGSLEGWKPKEFKSSRDEKFKAPSQKPTDFMDDEDFGEFGIAPHRVQTTSDFTSKNTNIDEISKKRKSTQQNDGPIPGVPVLHQLLEPSKDNIAIRLLKRMGWKEGQGIGARQTKREKKLNSIQNIREQYVLKKYGCEMGPVANKNITEIESEESDVSECEDITFAPDDFEPYVCMAKDNCFGLDYSGLSRDPVLKQHINLFGPLELLDNKKKKLSIRGKGFGVGALEEEDEDIYHHDDISNYDFSLEKPSKENKKLQKKPQDAHIIEGFSTVDDLKIHTKKVFIVNIPPNFTPRSWLQRKSRFEPLDETKLKILKRQDELKIKGLGRHDITAEERGAILEDRKLDVIKTSTKTQKEEEHYNKNVTYLEKINKKYTNDEKKKDEILDMLANKTNNFVKSETIEPDGTISKDESNNILEGVQQENEKILNEANKITINLASTTPSVFKPFLADPPKQERYEKFLKENFKSDEETLVFLRSIQPEKMSNWNRKMEKKEFEQAKKIYKPLQGLMSERFVTESTTTEEKKKIEVDPVRIGKTVRTVSIWHPASILCKRFNIAEPFVNSIKEEKEIKKPKLSVFDYLESSVNKKEAFFTPVIIPKADELKSVSSVQIETPKRIAAKDIFSKEVAEKTVSNEEVLSDTIANKKYETENLDNRTIEPQDELKNTREKKIKKEKPKSQLEKKIDELKNKHPSEKKELYKTVFEDSSESEECDNIGNEIKNKVEKKTTEIPNETNETSKNIVAFLNRPAEELNILRNTSPPRGIFAAFFKEEDKINKGFEIKNNNPEQNCCKPDEAKLIDSSTFKLQKINFKSKKERDAEILNENNSTYGPFIPNNLKESQFIPAQNNKVDIPSSSSEIDNKLQKLLGKHKVQPKIVEEWVEITNEKIKEKKNKKHKKKEKSKHRKHSETSSNSSDNHKSKKKEKKHKNKKKKKSN